MCVTYHRLRVLQGIIYLLITQPRIQCPEAVRPGKELLCSLLVTLGARFFLLVVCDGEEIY
jgi:hypothetical protein